jgi:6-phosphogluconolactonase
MSNLDLAGAVTPPILLSHPDPGHWIAAVVAETVAALEGELLGHGHARLLVSGGSTPAPVYLELARQSLDWANVEIGLVDERWLPIDDPDSNARLIRETLLTGRAAAAKFTPIRLPGQDFPAAVLAANQCSSPATIALLGMGPDGHTASLFPNMRELDQALDSQAYYVGVDASGCHGAGPWRQRISLTPAGLAKAATRLLLIRGEQKRDVIQRALAGNDLHELPIRAVFPLPGAPLRIHWCP